MRERTAAALAGTMAMAALLTLAFGPPVQAMTMQECSAKFKDARSAGTLNGMNWQAFRKAQCGADAAAATTTTAPKTATPTTTPKMGYGASAVFPSAVSPKYSNESAGKARLHTCLDQYKANKASNGNGGLVWIAKGGGYYSECNKRLKG
jgi:hypothetical protein